MPCQFITQVKYRLTHISLLKRYKNNRRSISEDESPIPVSLCANQKMINKIRKSWTHAISNLRLRPRLTPLYDSSGTASTEQSTRIEPVAVNFTASPIRFIKLLVEFEHSPHTGPIPQATSSVIPCGGVCGGQTPASFSFVQVVYLYLISIRS